MELMKPQIREFPFSTHVFERYSEVEKAPNSVILESCIQGTSTRNVMDVVESPGAENIYPHPVSTPASELDSKVKSILVRGIDRTMKFIYKDATHFNTRERWKVWKQSVVCVNCQLGKQEILSCKLCDSEMEWESFLDDLKEMGLKGIELVISDGHWGIHESGTRSFLSSE